MPYNKLPNQSIIQKTTDNLSKLGFQVHIKDSASNALDLIKTLIPANSSVMNGSSRTLEQIGFVDYLKSGKHGWNNLHEGIVIEKDPQKQSILRQQALHSDYYLGSVHALTQSGDIVIASNTGSQLPHITFTSPNVIFVVGAQKIVTDLSDAMNRLESHVVPLEDENMQQKYQVNTSLSKILILKHPSPITNRNFHVILVKEVLGF